MRPRKKQTVRGHAGGFSLPEVLISFGVLLTIFAGLIYGYVQANRMSEWSSMSLAAQSYASQGAEQARAANWSPRAYPVIDQTGVTNYSFWDVMDVPCRGNPASNDFNFYTTNYITITNYSANPPVRLIRSDCKWTFPLTGKVYSNTVILLRAGDQ